MFAYAAYTLMGVGIFGATFIFAVFSIGFCVEDLESKQAAHNGLAKAIGVFAFYLAIHFAALCIFDEQLSWHHYSVADGVWTLTNRGWLIAGTMLDVSFYLYLFFFGTFAFLDLTQ